MTPLEFSSPRRLRYRLAQGLGAIFSRIPPDRDATLAAVLTPEQRAAFLRLPAHDQSHLLRVLGLLETIGARASPDLKVAALLHDVGKVSPHGRVHLHDRVLRVVIGRLSPSLWAELSRLPAQGWRTGMALAEHHPRLGADQTAALGCSARACWLIAHHADRPLPDDDDLCLLVAADHAAG